MTPEQQSAHNSIEVVSSYSKLTIDWMKHLMTLSVGIIVIISAFHDHIGKGAFMVLALPFAMVCLLGCILCAMRVCFDLVYNEARNTTLKAWMLSGALPVEWRSAFQEEQQGIAKRDRDLSRYLRGANFTFASGVICLTAFVVRNLVLPTLIR